MKTKFLFRSMALAAVAAFTLSACNKADEKPTSENMKTVEGSMKIAYVEVDSIMEKYTFCKEYKAILDARSKKVENELAAQQQILKGLLRLSRISCRTMGSGINLSKGKN